MLTLICGLPRAGKTTYAEQFDGVIHLDKCGAYRGVIHNVQPHHGDVVVDGVYDKRFYRECLIKAYQGNGTRCIWLDTPQEVRRTRKGWNKGCDYPFEPPTLDEGWDEIIIIRGEHEQRINRQTED